MVQDDSTIIINNNITSKEDIIENAKKFFRVRIVENHIRNTRTLTTTSKFNINPFLHKYLANFLTGNDDSRSIAKALLYPRVLGTSITTTFGTQMQFFINEVLGSTGSLTPGIDIEFIDKIDGKLKFCQLKSGPNTINRGDVEPIKSEFRNLINLGRTNRRLIHTSDCVVGTLYGSFGDLNGHYLEINKDFPVYAGNEFWTHLTGDENFFEDLTDAIADIAYEFDGTELLEHIISTLAEEIENNKDF